MPEIANRRQPRSASRAALAVALLLAVAAAGAALVALAPGAPPAAAQAPVERFAQACESREPFFVTTQYARGPERDEPAVVAFHDTPDNSDQFVLATQRDVGAVFGTAYDPDARAVYVAAYLKRGTAYGPGGPGMIYRIDLATGDIEPWLEVPRAGPDPHDRIGGYWPDNGARNYVGFRGLGDIDLDDGAETLFVTNLLESEILRYRVADKTLLGRIDHGAAGEDWANETRPFGLKVWRGKLYHGVVHTAFRSQQPSDLAAFVYESDLDGSNMRLVNQFALDFDRGNAVGNVPARWQPWRNGYNTIGGNRGQWSVFPQPMLTDMEFAENGDMILGFRDRTGDMTFFDPGGRNPPGEGVGIPAGDLMISRYNGDTWDTTTTPEFFAEDAGPGLGSRDSAHDETGFGGLARLPKTDTVLTTALTPFRISSGGAYWYDIPSADNTAREELYNIESEVNFGKANGLGDVEILCGKFVPTATPTSFPTPTSTPRHTSTPRATPTVTATPTPSEYRIYLPQSERNPFCIPDAFHSDVVLVLDRSTSMLRSVEEGGLPKNEAAIQAAMAFVEVLDLTPDRFGRHDQVAVVGFNDTAWIESDLTFDRAEAIASLERIRHKTIEGTRLDLAVLAGQQPLDGPNRKPENRPVIILLTDGLPNRVPTPDPYGRQEETVLAATDQVKLKGSRIYTIGLGKPTDIMPRLLIAMASEPWMYYYAPRPEDLAGIYAQIAQTFEECDPAPFPTPDHCVPEEIRADVVLVLDMSTSMTRLTRANRTKFEAALEAAHLFVDLLDLDPDGWGRLDQVGVAGFNAEAWTAIGLSYDRPAIHLALDRLPDRQKEGTRLDLALLQGQAVLAGPGRIGENRPVMILLTDGLPNQVPTPAPSGRQEDTVLAAAQAAKNAGTFVYTVGLGRPDDIMAWLLEDAASDPSMFFYAPDGEDLADIYRQIAGRISECP